MYILEMDFERILKTHYFIITLASSPSALDLEWSMYLRPFLKITIIYRLCLIYMPLIWLIKYELLNWMLCFFYHAEIVLLFDPLSTDMQLNQPWPCLKLLKESFFLIFGVSINFQPFNLHLDFWKWRYWEIKVCFKP